MPIAASIFSYGRHFLNVAERGREEWYISGRYFERHWICSIVKALSHACLYSFQASSMYCRMRKRELVVAQRNGR